MIAQHLIAEHLMAQQRTTFRRVFENGAAVAEVVAGGVAFALDGDGSSGAGAVGAGGLDLFFGSHWSDLARMIV